MLRGVGQGLLELRGSGLRKASWLMSLCLAGSARGCSAASCGESLRSYIRAVWVMLAGRLATCYSRLSGWLLLWLKSWLSTLALLSPAALAPLGACRALAACWLGLLAFPATSPLALSARSLAESGPCFALRSVLVTFTLKSDSAAGRPLLRGAATLNGSSVPLGLDAVSETGYFCAGHLVSV